MSARLHHESSSLTVACVTAASEAHSCVLLVGMAYVDFLLGLSASSVGLVERAVVASAGAVRWPNIANADGSRSPTVPFFQGDWYKGRDLPGAAVVLVSQLALERPFAR